MICKIIILFFLCLLTIPIQQETSMALVWVVLFGSCWGKRTSLRVMPAII